MLKQVSVEPPSALSMMLPASAAERRRLENDARSGSAAIDRYLLPAGHSAANPLAAVTAVNQQDTQTEGHPTVTYTPFRMLCGQR